MLKYLFIHLKKGSRATLRCLAGRMWNAGRTLPRPDLNQLIEERTLFCNRYWRIVLRFLVAIFLLLLLWTSGWFVSFSYLTLRLDLGSISPTYFTYSFYARSSKKT
jgi:hypothetical protein